MPRSAGHSGSSGAVVVLPAFLEQRGVVQAAAAEAVDARGAEVAEDFFSSTSSQRSLWSTAAVPMQPRMALMSLSP